MFTFPKPPSGVQIKEPRVVLLQNAVVCVVEAVGGYPVALNPDSNEQMNDGPLCKPSAAAAMKKTLTDFLATPHKYKRWGEVIKACMASSKRPACDFTPWPALRDVLLSLTKESPPAAKENPPAAVPPSPKKTNTPPALVVPTPPVQTPAAPVQAPSAETATPKKRKTPEATSTEQTGTPPVAQTATKRIKLSDVRSENEFSNITPDQWLLALAEMSHNPAQFSSENHFVWAAAQRLLAFFHLINPASK